jgi:diguanylate cyclase (GGDEF)-like protein
MEHHTATTTAQTGVVLIVEDEAAIRVLLRTVFERAHYHVIEATDGQEGLEQAREVLPDLIVSDVVMPRLDGFEMVRALRRDPTTREIPVIMLTAKGETEDIVTGLELGADDYLSKPFKIPELLARARAKLSRPPVPSELIPRDRKTGLLTEQTFLRPLERELARAERTKQPLCLAYLHLEELPRLRQRFGMQVETRIARQIAELIALDARSTEVLARDNAGNFRLMLPETDAAAARKRLERLSQRIVSHVFVVGSERLRLTPSLGFSQFKAGNSADVLMNQAIVATEYASAHLDLHIVRFDPAKHRARPQHLVQSRWTRAKEALRLPTQMAAVTILSIFIPFLGYLALARLGYDISPVMYIVVVVTLSLTALLIWIEGLLALKPDQPPIKPGAPPPPASAIIAAYLPNEAATVVETIEAFLRIDYPEALQIILAYNTPRDLPVEQTLQEIAARDARFMPLRVAGSTSKAQNVNAALAEVTGEFVGVFDADHQPDPDSFARAWRWLSNGYDVVQGHCLVRNGNETWVSRLVAVEFEAIYAVSHPGRARLHHFGIFGGSNGYWRTELLRRIRMHGFMLTEDIDSSLRAIESGASIASDPFLISRELAPITLKALTNQRLRWAQGWFQVSLKHLWLGLRSKHLSGRQKLGLIHLLAWREIYPVLSVQMFPIILFWLYEGRALEWFVPIFVLTTLFTLSVSPGQTLFAYLRAEPQIRQHRHWFASYFVISSVFYGAYKNLIAVVAQLKELRRERQWKVTPRSSDKPA